MTDLELTARMVLSLLFGTVVGLERQWHHKNAGLKTNTLVAVGAAAFTLIAQHGFGSNVFLPQVAAGVVTGIGFIGGGVIMRRGGNVQGINSAATLWATASMGLSIGAGYYKLAWLVLSIVLSIQFLQQQLASWIDRRSHALNPRITYSFLVSHMPSAAESLRSVWSEFTRQPGLTVLHYEEARNTDSENSIRVSLSLSDARVQDLTAFTQMVAAMPGVKRAEWSQAQLEEER